MLWSWLAANWRQVAAIGEIGENADDDIALKSRLKSSRKFEASNRDL